MIIDTSRPIVSRMDFAYFACTNIIVNRPFCIQVGSHTLGYVAKGVNYVCYEVARPTFRIGIEIPLLTNLISHDFTNGKGLYFACDIFEFILYFLPLTCTEEEQQEAVESQTNKKSVYFHNIREVNRARICNGLRFEMQFMQKIYPSIVTGFL